MFVDDKRAFGTKRNTDSTSFTQPVTARFGNHGTESKATAEELDRIPRKEEQAGEVKSRSLWDHEGLRDD